MVVAQVEVGKFINTNVSSSGFLPENYLGIKMYREQHFTHKKN